MRAASHDYRQCQPEPDDILLTYYDDFVKYAKKIDPTSHRNALQSVVLQIGSKNHGHQCRGVIVSDMPYPA